MFDLERTTMERLSVLLTHAAGAKMLCAGFSKRNRHRNVRLRRVVISI
jgi:hypothetical protein